MNIFRALRPFCRVLELSVTGTVHYRHITSLPSVVRTIFNLHSIFTRIMDIRVERNNVSVPNEIIICTIFIWYLCSVITVGENTLQLRWQHCVVLVPEAGGGQSLLWWAGVFYSSNQVPSILATPTANNVDNYWRLVQKPQTINNKISNTCGSIMQEVRLIEL